VPENTVFMKATRERMMEKRTGGEGKEGAAAKEGDSQTHEH